MAGTLVISDSSDWLPAGWVFNNAMEGLARYVEKDAPGLAQELLDSRTTVSMGYFDMRQMDVASFRCLLNAARQTVATARKQDPASCDEPEFLRGYVARLEELCDLLAQDPRAGSENGVS